MVMAVSFGARAALLGLGSLVALAAVGATSPARAVDLTTPDPSYVTFGVGPYNVLREKKEVQGRVEYRFSDQFFYLKPQVGILGTDQKSVYAYAGVRLDVYLTDHVVVTPNFDLGYWAKGDGKNLGSWMEFKSGGEIAYRFDDHSRLGIAFDHMSNAGLTKSNPGVESLVVLYSYPLGSVK